MRLVEEPVTRARTMAVALAVISSMLICRSVTADEAAQNKSTQLKILDIIDTDCGKACSVPLFRIDSRRVSGYGTTEVVDLGHAVETVCLNLGNRIFELQE
jgi:hypothetical protein